MRPRGARKLKQSAPSKSVTKAVFSVLAGAFLPANDLSDPAVLSRYETTENLLREYFCFRTSATRREKWQSSAHKELRKTDTGRRVLARRRRQVQKEIDARLLAVLNGVDPRTAFKKGMRRTRGEHLSPARDQSITLEVLRLHKIHGLDESVAKQLVADAYEAQFGESIDIRTVQAAVKKWRDSSCFSDDRLNLYVRMLRVQNLID